MPLVLPMELVKKAADKETRQEEFAKAVAELYDGSKLGDAMYADKVFELAGVIVNQRIETELEEQKKNIKDINDGDVQAVEQRIMAVLEAMPVAKNIPRVRDVKLKYGDEVVSVKVQSLMEQVKLSVAAWWVKVGEERGVIPLAYGAELLDIKNVYPDSKLKGSLGIRVKTARDALSTAIVAEKAYDADSLNQLVAQKMKDLKALDPQAKLTAAIIRMITGEGAASRMQASLLELFPSQGEWKDPATVLQQITHVMASRVFQLAPRETRAQTTTVKNMIVKIVDKQTPDLKDAMKNTFTKVFVDRLRFFIRVKVGGDGEKHVLHGTAGLQALYESLQAKRDKGVLKHEETKIFETFEWLMDPALKEKVKVLRQALTQETVAAGMAKLKGKALRDKNTKTEPNDKHRQAAVDMFKKKGSSSTMQALAKVKASAKSRSSSSTGK